MTIIKLKQEEIKFLKCFYGKDKKVINVSNRVREYLNACVKNKKYFIILKINNKIMGYDPIPKMCKIFNLHFKNNQYNIKENKIICFNINLSFDVIFKSNMHKIELDKYKYATIFGKGPTFKNVEKKDNELRCAINQAANNATGVDFLCMNDHHNIFKINDEIYKNLKYLLIPEYLHINQSSYDEGYFVNIINYLNSKFFGNLIIYDLATSKKKTEYIVNLETAQSSGNNCFEFVCKYTEIKNVDFYGIGLKSKNNYHDNFIGNGSYTDKIIELIVKVINICSKRYNVKYKLN